MTRQIKFRAWREDLKKMSSPFKLFESDENYLLNGDHMDATDCPVMQYTGLKDKNGKEIYEGDIVEPEHKGTPTGVVAYSVSEFVLKNGSFVDPLGPLVRNKWKLEVIGNIYENPELLK